jgi:hypothetical protein
MTWLLRWVEIEFQTAVAACHSAQVSLTTASGSPPFKRRCAIEAKQKQPRLSRSIAAVEAGLVTV